MDRRVSLLLEEPLTQVLLVARLGPTVIVDVEHPLLLPLFLSRRSSLTLLTLSSLRLLRHYWLLQLKSLIMTLSLLLPEDCQVPDSTNMLLNPVEILADEFIMLLEVVAEEDVTV